MTNLKLSNERDGKTSSDHQITEGEVDEQWNVNSGSNSLSERWEESVTPKIALSKNENILEGSIKYIKNMYLGTYS